MAAQDAKRFVDELVADPKLAEELRVDAPRDESAADYYVSVAANRGFDFTVDDLKNELKARQEATIAVVDGAELDDSELDQVAGGWCWFNDACTTAVTFTKHNDDCRTTFLYSERCLAVDNCPDVVFSY